MLTYFIHIFICSWHAHVNFPLVSKCKFNLTSAADQESEHKSTEDFLTPINVSY